MANEVRVLLADASEEYRILLTDTIEETGEFQVVGSTGDGAQLVQMARQLQPQVVIMDLVLPGLDGFGALAELERESILERQHEGIEIAKAEGKYKGRKPVAVDEAKFRAVCARWHAGEIIATAAMQEVGLKPNTFYRRVKEMKL